MVESLIALLIVILIAVLVIVIRALPLIGVSV